jgi:arylformamidase
MKTVYNGYTQDELDKQHNFGLLPYTPDGVVVKFSHRPEHMQQSARQNKSCSEEYLKLLKPQENIPYGEHPKQVFDLYKAEGDNTPCVIMLSGGGFMRGRTKVWSQWSKKCIENGISFIDLDHPQIPSQEETILDDSVQPPSTTLLDMIDNAERFIYWIRDELPNYGIDPNRLILAGHSSGAGVLSTAVARISNAGNADGIRGLVLLSGYYDFLGPSLSFRQKFLKLSPSEIIKCSAIRNIVRPLPPVLIGTGEETEEIIQHANRFHEAISWIGESEKVLFPTDHFGLGMELYDDKSKMWQFITKKLAFGPN